MNQEEILALAGDTLTSKTHEVNVAFPEEVKTYRISPALVGNKYRISAIANKVPRDLHVNGTFNNYKVWEAINEHTDSLLMATALCIQNREKEPSYGFLNKLKNMIGSEGVMFNVLFKSLEQPGVSDFYNMYKLDNRPKCTECAGAGGDCETCKGTGYKKEESESNDNSPWSLIGSYRKYFKCGVKEVLWGMSWTNFIMDLASIPSSESITDSKEKADEEMHVAPEDEMAQLKQDLGL